MATSRSASSRDSNGRTLDQYLGNAIRELRQRHNLTIANVAESAEISRGMLSKIENGQTSTSLDTLSNIANALGITLSSLFLNFNVPVGGAQHVKKGEGMEVRAAWHQERPHLSFARLRSGPEEILRAFFSERSPMSAKFFPRVPSIPAPNSFTCWKAK